MSEWIRVEDKMPEDGVGVLVTDGTDVSAGRRRWGYWHPHEVDIDYGSGADISFEDRVTHWMPLPAPPEK